MRRGILSFIITQPEQRMVTISRPMGIRLESLTANSVWKQSDSIKMEPAERTLFLKRLSQEIYRKNFLLNLMLNGCNGLVGFNSEFFTKIPRMLLQIMRMEVLKLLTRQSQYNKLVFYIPAKMEARLGIMVFPILKGRSSNFRRTFR